MPASTVLMLHHVTDNPTVKRSILMGTDRFKAFIESFDNYTDVSSCVKDYKSKKMAITFDDALTDVYTIAFPYLEKRGIPFTVFAAPGLLNQDGYLTTVQLREMSRCPLVTIGSHALSHVPMRNMGKEFQYKELYNSKSLLENIIEKKVDIIAYPYGQYDMETIRIIKEDCAYRLGFSASGGPINAVSIHHPLRLPRLRLDDKTMNDVRRLLRAVYSEARG